MLRAPRATGITDPMKILEYRTLKITAVLLCLSPVVAEAQTVIGIVEDGPMWEPMAIAIIFGLLFATVLTLGVVPILYGVMFRVKFS